MPARVRSEERAALRYQIMSLTSRMSDAAIRLRQVAARVGLDPVEVEALFVEAMSAETEAAADRAVDEIRRRLLAALDERGGKKR